MEIKPFNQSPPELGNQYEEDRVLRSYLKRNIPADIFQQIESSLIEMGKLSGGELYNLQLADCLNEPVLTQWNAWGERIDQIDVSPLWKEAEKLAAKYGLVAAAYEKQFGRHSRIYQFALSYLFHPSSDFYTCPLAMTDGAARTLLHSGNQKLIDRAVPYLTSRDPLIFWTSGQWMTESTGGSDVGQSETIARQDTDGHWRLYGRKWFTSATTSQMALTLARPEGNGPGGKGLALFYIETRDASGRLQNILVNRLKDKLGTRKVPTAELTLNGTPAELVMGTTNGVANIVPMLQMTRTWNSVMAAATMRRGIALTRDYALKRQAFGAPLSEKPLHAETLSGLQAEFEAAFHLSFYLVELIGREENSQLSDEQSQILRLLTSIAKLTTGRQAVYVASEVLEAFGGAGYVEDTGIPLLLRDSQVLPIWEGTTNVLALDMLRAFGKNTSALQAFIHEIERHLSVATHPQLGQAGKTAFDAANHVQDYIDLQKDHEIIEASARRIALTLGRALALALMIDHAQWSLDNENDSRALAAAKKIAKYGIDFIQDVDLDESFSLANDR